MATDFHQIYSIQKANFPYPWKKEDLHQEFEKNNNFYVEKVQDQIVAYCFFRVSCLEEMAHLIQICTKKNKIKTGIATTLLRKAIYDLCAQGCKRLFLEVAHDNQAAIGLYRKFGFKRLNTIKKFYRDGKDAYVMQLEFV
ncbi:MAG: ribosomal protein S18-alanine N-acetyltransferase [Bacteriovoracaceae bacterium]|nr:ribosomal protein S18-alanine N-acetyltransferase [Bacteriovoracaceae bacterium]